MDSIGNSRIYSIWDQTINPCTISGDDSQENECASLEYGRIPEGFSYGVEYTNEEINEALASENPWGIVQSRDFNGHGTFIAGVACGTLIEEKNFSGVAPLTTICAVKCKEAKQGLKSFYHIDTDEPVYAETDILIATEYLRKKAAEANMPLILCFGMGTSFGGHITGGILGEVLRTIGDTKGAAVVTACGNEGNTSRHYRSDILASGEDVEVEIRSGSRHGFTLELYSDSPQILSVSIISPSGGYSGKTIARHGEKRRVDFILEDTVVNIEYSLLSYESGDEFIQMRFETPSEGIWKIRVFNETRGNAYFDMWLPIRNFLPPTTYFLEADPNITLCCPSNNANLISVSYYDSLNRSIAVDSSRGFARNGNIKPDFAAPGINIYGPLPRLGNLYPLNDEEKNLTARYDFRSGSSMAAAITAGAAALLMEWGILRGNDVSMDTVIIQKYLIRGADSDGVTEANRLWGNGTLNVYDVFERLRGN